VKGEVGYDARMKLSVVATPIGNLEDMTLRALRTLKEADLILCEDTRVTKRLLMHYRIETSTMSYHEHSGRMKIDKIASLLTEGKHLALVSDAGTPGISDPGSFLIEKLREQLGNELTIEVIPGPSALTSAIAVAGTRADDFVFVGFLPHKKGRETLFSEIATISRAVIFYESPHRIVRTLEALSRHIGERKMYLCRELTKIHEEVLQGSAAELIQTLDENQEKIRGEFVVIISPL
jgi:16S rRNA (cytidine1402-2'-O)-methyltransferase